MPTRILIVVILAALATGCGDNGLRDPASYTKQELLGVAAQFNLRKGFHIIEGLPVYLDGNAGEGKIVRMIPEADGTTFRALEQSADARALYAVDAKNVFVAMHYNVQKLPVGDGASFELLTPDSDAFCRDSTHVYYFGVVLEGADPLTFQVLEHPFSKDAQHAFVGTIPIPVKDIESWRPLQKGYAEDPWYRSRKDTHPREHSTLYASGWSKDSFGLYYGNKAIPEADPTTFVILSDYYSKDRNHVYYADDVVPDADPATFEMHDGRYLKGTRIHMGSGPDSHDSKRMYQSGKIYSE